MCELNLGLLEEPVLLTPEPAVSPVPCTLKKNMSLCVFWGTDMLHTHLWSQGQLWGVSFLSFLWILGAQA